MKNKIQPFPWQDLNMELMFLKSQCCIKAVNDNSL